jgi:predicted transposase/invertase (TIGR01784 family)
MNNRDWREHAMTWEMDLKIIQEDAEKKGEKKGIEKGIKKGIEKGAKEKALAIAKTLKKMGTMSDNDIAKVTELPLHEVAAL